MYTVEITRKAQKEIKKLGHQARDRVLDALEELKDDPRPHGVRKLKGNPVPGIEEDLYRLRVGDYRVIYAVYEEDLLVLVVRARHRRDAYR